MNRIPSLDGLRAISISFVLLGHLAGTSGFPISPSALSFLEIAELGVRVFFVISGFLITGLLLREIEQSATISLPRFYLRRTLRIFPAYYVMLVCIWLASAAGLLDLNAGDLLHAFTYTTNYHGDRAWWLGHTWSLAVEEQFYLLWPATLVLFGPKRGVRIACGVLVIVPIVRLSEWYAGWHGLIGNSFETVCDSLATGCILAGAREAIWKWAWYKRLLTSRWFACVPVVALALSGLSRPRFQFAVGMTLSNLCIAATIDWAVRYDKGRVGRLLNAAPLVFIGVLSYSLYLWQQPFLNRSSDGWPARFPINVVLALVCALASYYLIERPALAVRSRLRAPSVGRDARFRDPVTTAAPVPNETVSSS